MHTFPQSALPQLSRARHPERPQRIERTAPLLKDRHPGWEWREPHAANEATLLRAHSPAHIERIAKASDDFDLDTPVYPDIDKYAMKSAGAAVGAGRADLSGERAFSLMRPPGHHATRNRAMG